MLLDNVGGSAKGSTAETRCQYDRALPMRTHEKASKFKSPAHNTVETFVGEAKTPRSYLAFATQFAARKWDESIPIQILLYLFFMQRK